MVLGGILRTATQDGSGGAVSRSRSEPRAGLPSLSRSTQSLEVYVVEAVFLSGSIVYLGKARQGLQPLVEWAAGVDHQVIYVIAAQYVVGFFIQGGTEEEAVYVEVALRDVDVGPGQLLQLIAVSYHALAPLAYHVQRGGVRGDNVIRAVTREQYARVLYVAPDPGIDGIRVVIGRSRYFELAVQSHGLLHGRRRGGGRQEGH